MACKLLSLSKSQTTRNTYHIVNCTYTALHGKRTHTLRFRTSLFYAANTYNDAIYALCDLFFCPVQNCILYFVSSININIREIRDFSGKNQNTPKPKRQIQTQYAVHQNGCIHHNNGDISYIDKLQL